MVPFHLTRLAPSPTGALHLGHARTFLFTWWLARQAGAKVILRLDDLDATRVKPETVDAMLSDLRWLGLTWQDQVVQSDRRALYANALQRLWERGAAYPCVCSRREVEGAASAPHEGEGGPRYPGTCRGQFASLLAGAATAAEAESRVRQATGRGTCWRLKVEPGVVPFTDQRFGERSFDVSADAGDFALTKADGTPAYQLSSTVDDLELGVDLVARGDDLLPSTPRQMLIAQALAGACPIRWLHVPLVVGGDGRRLAKRAGESRIGMYRKRGVPAQRLVGWAAWRSGMIDRPREMTAEEAVGLSDIARLPMARLQLEDADWRWLSKGAVSSAS